MTTTAINSPALGNSKAELALIGSAFRGDGEALAGPGSHVREEWFGDSNLRLAWRVLAEMMLRGHLLTLTLLEDGMVREGVSAEAAKKISAALSDASPSFGLWRNYSEIVEAHFKRRRGMEICREALEQFADMQVLPKDAIERAESGLFQLHSGGTGPGMRHISAATAEALASIEENIANRGHVTGGLACGFTDIDRCNMKGLRPGHMWVIAAPPGGGKTVILVKLLWNMATNSGDYRTYSRHHPAVPAGVFSLEMSDVQLAERVLVRLAQIELNKMDRGNTSRGEAERLKEAEAMVKRSLMHLEWCPGASIHDLRVKARHAVARYGLQVLGFDYAQLIAGSERARKRGRTEELQEVSLGLSDIADECGVPIIVCAQPKQDEWGKKFERPGLNSLAETSQLAKDADLVGLMDAWDERKCDPDYRSKHKGDDPENVFGDADADAPSFSYFDIAKNRHGPNTVGKAPIKLHWPKEFYDFRSTNDVLFDPQGKQVQQS